MRVWSRRTTWRRSVQLTAAVACLVGASAVAAPAAVAAGTATLSGVVQDGGGNELAGCTVVIYTVGTTTEVAETTTATDGSYSVDVAPASYDVVVNPPAGSGFHPATFGDYAINGPTVLDVVLTTAQAVTFSGVVETSKGVVIPGASLYLSGPASYSTRTSSTGGFSFSLAPGDYTAQITNVDNGDCADYPYSFNVSAPLSITGNLQQNLVIPVAAVTVQVSDPSGSAVPGATLSVTNGYRADPFAVVPGGAPTTSAIVNSGGAVTTGPDGTATIAVIPSSQANISITATPPAADTTFTKVAVSNLSVTTDPTNVKILIQSTDVVAPVIQAVLSDAPSTSGWFDQPVTVGFDCTDSGSGVADCSSPVTESTDGIYTVTGTAEDHAGNVTTTTQTIRIDTTPPTVAASVPAPPATGWYTTPVTVDGTCNDPTVNGASSGVADCPAAQTLSTDGAGQSVTGKATDSAGNSADASATGINIDQTPPSVTATVTSTQPESTYGWYHADATVSFHCTDATSGVATCPAPQTVSTEGASQTLHVSATDVAGNRSAVLPPITVTVA